MNTQVEQLNNDGVQFFLGGKFSEAKQKYEEALSLSPNYPTTLNNLGMLLLKEEDFKKAEYCFKQAIKVKESATYLANLGHVYANQREFALAEQQYIKAIEKDQQSLLAYKSLAGLYQYIRKYEASVTIWKYILETLSHDMEYKLNLAKDCIHLENYTLALSILLEVTQQEPKKHEAYYYISMIQFHQKNFGIALDAIYQSLSIHPDNASYRKLAASLHLALSNFKKAEEQWNFLLTLNENHHDVRIDKAIGLLSIQQFEKALEELEFILKQTNHNKASFYKALVLLELKRDETQAIETLTAFTKGSSEYAIKAKEYLQELKNSKTL